MYARLLTHRFLMYDMHNYCPALELRNKRLLAMQQVELVTVG